MDTKISLRVTRCEDVALDVKLLELEHVDGAPLPAFEAGAHVELQLSEQLARSYSLLNSPAETNRYQIAVHRRPDSLGGSHYIHETLRAGQVVQASHPRNNFPLLEDAGHTCLIAGGIGITPLLSMLHRLNALGRSWELHYCARTAGHAAFVEALIEIGKATGNRIHYYFDRDPGGKSLDFDALVGSLPAHTHVYCCGPKGMLNDFERSTAHCSERAHVEYFNAKTEAATDGGFTVVLSRSGLNLQVPPGRTILDVVLDAGVSVQCSGSCETRIISGEADHRDALLSPEEQAANQCMMICCSGAKSPELVLDL
ncbi:PDR/VanB family oxidoreductase [Cupriavidus sp. L7L]|uniref:PDR/VanB family oxidoreductase n=1 Tax=Cupriavidus sp. L7L TaxID=2546443 RepID=UPI00105528AB|nr:PDR/VanB family oxidoreductase [Cupriavidus sp. L7L]TDF64965.1 oxidoreductase [Cupriavidus sp. L7L]